jgi:hypothetical protein
MRYAKPFGVKTVLPASGWEDGLIMGQAQQAGPAPQAGTPQCPSGQTLRDDELRGLRCCAPGQDIAQCSPVDYRVSSPCAYGTFYVEGQGCMSNMCPDQTPRLSDGRCRTASELAQGVCQPGSLQVWQDRLSTIEGESHRVQACVSPQCPPRTVARIRDDLPQGYDCAPISLTPEEMAACAWNERFNSATGACDPLQTVCQPPAPCPIAGQIRVGGTCMDPAAAAAVVTCAEGEQFDLATGTCAPAKSNTPLYVAGGAAAALLLLGGIFVLST